MSDQRPDPDELLARVQAQEDQPQPGKPKIFLGGRVPVGPLAVGFPGAR